MRRGSTYRHSRTPPTSTWAAPPGNRQNRIGVLAGEMKTAARVLLRELVVIQPPVIRAEGHVVRGAGPDQVFADLVGGVVIQRRVLVGQAGKTARKSQRRRAVIC